MKLASLLLMSLVLAPMTGQAGISVKVNGLSASQEAIVRKAADIAISRMTTEIVVKCVLKYAKRAKTATAKEWKFKNADDKSGHVGFAVLALQMGGFAEKGTKHNIDLTINGANLQEPITGQANLDTISDTKKKFVISVNKNTVGKSGWFSKPEFWSETIAHEMLHNVALSHGDNGDFDRDYANFVITEWGYCTESLGKTGSADTGFGLTAGRPRAVN